MSNQDSPDYLIIGAGVAGLRAAIELANHGTVLVVTKEALGESNTHYAQGGIAVAMSGEEDIALHLQDTEYAGDGLVSHAAAKALVTEGPMRVNELIDWGTNFDRNNGDREGRLLLAREAAHSLPRILHANGDATGAEISRALLAYAQQHPNIQFADWTMASKLVVEGNRAVAADLFSEKNPSTLRRVTARAILIASGGAGQVYSDTTNPAVATGDGIALAAEAGAELADMEFYQFHPTALSLPNVPRFLLSEALRGAGAYLRNHLGERFMSRYHPQLELAPRDVVARAIAREGMDHEGNPLPVYLDLRHLNGEAEGIPLPNRFPGITRFLAQHGLDLATDLIPVRPAAHYLMGGVRTDLDGRTSIQGLYAAGEAACTGVHGANRLASNSLLEGLVFGARAAKAILKDNLPVPSSTPTPPAQPAASTLAPSELAQAVTELRHQMFQNAGLLRDQQSLDRGQAALRQIQNLLSESGSAPPTRQRIEARSLARVAQSILLAAQARRESRGAHYRNDHPTRNDSEFQKHSIEKANKIEFQSWP